MRHGWNRRLSGCAREASPRISLSQDLRCGGTWTWRQRLKNDIIHCIIRRALAVADRLPAGLLIAVAKALGILAHAVCGSARRHATRQVSIGLPQACASRLARESFRLAGESLGLSLLLRRKNTSALRWVDVDPRCRGKMNRALAHGRGVVFISAHLGPFELIAAALAELGYRPAVLVRESYDPRLNQVVDAHRTARGVQVIHRGSPLAAGRVLHALRAGRPVGFLPDLGGRVRSTSVRLMGCSSELAIGPMQIALRTGAPVLVGFLVPRAPARASDATRAPPFLLEVVPIPDIADASSGSQQVADILSRAIARAPERWLWMGARLQVMATGRGDRLIQVACGS
ncbi:MAG: lysophospholipid acyltransferase family protein [Polyangiaceae bacterium]|nr:lysophospholipid acyltransferase family protein [Polyangiaceae bacterium]